MGKPRAEELWAARIVSDELSGAAVRVHDDGSSDGLFDLMVSYPDGRTAAVEVTTATDAAITEQWKAIQRPSARWTDRSLVGGWSVALRPGASIRRVRARLPGLLRRLEAAGITEVNVQGWPRGEYQAAACELGIAHLLQSATSYPGSIYPKIELPLDRSGGWEQPTVNAVAEWIGEFARARKQDDNLRKLAASATTERHLFVILHSFTTAPFAVSGPLMAGHLRVPMVPASLPDPVTHVWLVSTWSAGTGLRWDPSTGWTRVIVANGSTA